MSYRPDSDCGGIRTIAGLMDRCTVDESNCWTWKGARSSKGAPSVYCPAIKSRTTLGVVIAVLKTGQRPLPGTRWYTTCETKDCANPAHRKQGTHSEALQGLKRPHDPLGSHKASVRNRARTTKLSLAIAEEIRASNEPPCVLARKYGVTWATISRVRAFKMWRPMGPWMWGQLAA